ncbi:Polyketide synthase PksN, partial [Durusdinium trenchii]
ERSTDVNRSRPSELTSGHKAPYDLDPIVVSFAGLYQASLPIAAARAGAVGLFDISHADDAAVYLPELRRMVELVNDQRYGLLIDAQFGTAQRAALESIRSCEMIVLSGGTGKVSSDTLQRVRQVASRVGMVVTSLEQATQAAESGVDFLLAKGLEAGGVVGELTTFILLQQLTANSRLPVYAWGGIGFNTAAACRVAGAAGVVLDWQLALMNESPLPPQVKAELEEPSPPQTFTLPAPEGRELRGFFAGTNRAHSELPSSLHTLSTSNAAEWKAEIARQLGNTEDASQLFCMSQDAALAAAWHQAAPSVARALKLLNERVTTAIDACTSTPLAEGSPLADSHGTKFPIAQAPMTRMSDVPAFALQVAEEGGLPFLALGRRKADQARELLQEASKLLAARSWGVSLLGLASSEARPEHIAAVEETCPPYAIVDARQPQLASSLEGKGIATYLKVASPEALPALLAGGARRFIFEGLECGGVVGPLSSFALWEQAIQKLADAKLSADEASQVHVLLSGGVHDRRSAAMVTALAQPLIELGMKAGFLLGTPYLFTEEFVSTGAIVSGFQEEALNSDHTVLLKTDDEHGMRCAATNFIQTFEGEKSRLKQENVSAEQMHDELVHLMLGRLRIASKGKSRRSKPAAGESPVVDVDREQQRQDGLYPLGQLAILRSETCSLHDLHQDVCQGAAELLRGLEPSTRITVVEEHPAPPPLDIAIIGMSCLLPGADNLTSYWDNILQKRDLVDEVPDDRFDTSRWFDRDRAARDKIYSKWGGFLDDVEFDPLKYGIPPMALKSIEPMQLLALELVDRSLRDAGYRDNNPHKERTSVILGAGGGIAELGAGYALRSALPGLIEEIDERVLGQLPEWTEDSFAGILLNVVAGRISNRFDLGGVNFTVDAACASSLSALYLACRELADYTSDMVITGGCDTLQSPFTYLCFAKAGALSPRGRSRTFDATSDGIAISEGLASIVLKRREDAERDGDRIYAVIRAAAGGSDGRSKGMATPRIEGQMRTIERAYAQALAANLRELLDPLRTALTANHAPALADLAYTWHRRQPSTQPQHQATIVSATPNELADQLAALLAQLQSGSGELDSRRLPAGVHCTSKPLGKDRPLAFLFPGQGSQYPNMLRSLAVEFSEVSRRFEMLDRELGDAFEQPLSTYVFPPPEFSDEERKQSAENLKPTDRLQPILGASDTGMLRLLESFGLRPNMVAGHSYGELVALHAAGSIDESALYRLSLARGRAISEMTAGNQGDLGSMLAVRAGETEVGQAIAECDEAWLANMNSPRQTIIAGSRRGIEDAVKKLNAARLAFTPIAVACGFHSPLMDPARKQLDCALKQLDFRPPRIDVYSNTTAKPYPKGPAEIREQLSEHLVRQVRFAAQIDTMYQDGAPVFIEVGPGRVLSKLLRDVLGDRPHVAVSTQNSAQGGLRQLLDALGQLVSHGVEVKFDRLYRGRPLTELKLESLASENSKPSPHTWLINGSYVRPATEPKRSHPIRVALLPEGAQPSTASKGQDAAPPTKPAAPAATPSAPRAVPQPQPSPVVASNGSPPAPEPRAAMEATPKPATPQVTTAPGASSIDDFALSEFQQTMREFLRAQENVLTAFFGGSPPAAAQQMPATPAALPAAAPIAAQPPVAQTPPP